MPKTKQKIKQHLLSAGVKNLNEFGYADVSINNIITDEVYSQFFKSMLNDNLGHSPTIDEAINELLTEIKNIHA